MRTCRAQVPKSLPLMESQMDTFKWTMKWKLDLYSGSIGTVIQGLRIKRAANGKLNGHWLICGFHGDCRVGST